MIDAYRRSIGTAPSPRYISHVGFVCSESGRHTCTPAPHAALDSKLSDNVRALVLTCGTMPCTSCLSVPVYTMLGSVPRMQVPCPCLAVSATPRVKGCFALLRPQPSAPRSNVYVQSTLIFRAGRGKAKLLWDLCQARACPGGLQGRRVPRGAAFDCGRRKCDA